jgi:hypothetical protein
VYADDRLIPRNAAASSTVIVGGSASVNVDWIE